MTYDVKLLYFYSTMITEIQGVQCIKQALAHNFVIFTDAHCVSNVHMSEILWLICFVVKNAVK